MGSIFAIYSVVDNKIPQLYLFAPIYNSETVLKHLKRKYTRGLKCFYRPFFILKIDEHIANISPAEKIKNYTGKLMIFHGKKDKTLPYKMGEKLYKVAKTNNKYLYKEPQSGDSFIFKEEYWGKIITEINQNNYRANTKKIIR